MDGNSSDHNSLDMKRKRNIILYPQASEVGDF